MRLGIDASNIRTGGGVRYLQEFLSVAEPHSAGFEVVGVWSGKRTLAALPEKPWLRRIHEPALDRGLLRRTGWRMRTLGTRLRDFGADVLFVPGGIHTGSFRPFVVVSQNVLPFEDGERQRYGWSLARLRLELVRRAQLRSFASADGVVFTTTRARNLIESEIAPEGQVATILCGVNERFRLEPRLQQPIEAYSADRPFKWLYASTVNLYKHQWYVVEAVARLRREGLPVALDLVGRAYGPARRRLLESIDRWDPAGEFVTYLTYVPEIMDAYAAADGAVFASSCETPSFVLLECMAAGLPIACARRSGMPEVLADGGEYFDPEDATSIADAMREMLLSPLRRSELAEVASTRSRNYTWSRCAQDTMALIASTAHRDEQD